MTSADGGMTWHGVQFTPLFNAHRQLCGLGATQETHLPRRFFLDVMVKSNASDLAEQSDSKADGAK